MTQHKNRKRKTRRIQAAASNETPPKSFEMLATMDITAAADGADGEQKLPTFKMVAYTGGLMRLRGWYRPVVVDLEGLSIPSQTIPIREGHENRVGHTDHVAVEGGKLVASGVISCTGATAQELVADAKNGFPWQASMGAEVDKFESIDEKQTASVNGKTYKGPILVARKTMLGEISFVDMGADRKTSARVAAKVKEGVSDMELTAEEIKQIEAQRKAAIEGVKAPENTPPKAPEAPAIHANQPQPSFSDIDAEIAEGRRRETIRGMAIAAVRAANNDPRMGVTIKDLSERAIESKMTVEQFDHELLLHSRPPVLPPGHGTTQALPQETMEAAAMLSCGFDGNDLVKTHGEQTVNTAEKQFGQSMGLQELIVAAAQANGYSGRTRITPGNWREVMSWARGGHQAIQAGGYSTVDLTGILGAVANKALAAVAAEPQWLTPLLAGTVSQTNFHSHTAYSLAMNGELLEVGPTGELKNLKLAEESYTRQVGTRGAVLKISRTDVINDDLGVFTRNASGLARKAYQTREKVLMTKIMVSAAGASHFTAARGNYLTGAGTAFGAAAMATAIAAFRGLTGPDGDPVMVEPSLVLVPPTLEDEAARLLASGSNAIISGYTGVAARTFATSANIYAGRYGGRPLVSPWLEVATITGYSTAYWYIMADPNTYPCYEVSYLNGVQTPTVDSFGLDADVDTLGMSWRVYWDFGCDSAEWRAGVKLAGA